MLIELPVAWVACLNTAGWPCIQLGLAWAFTRMPTRWFSPQPTTVSPSESRFYEQWLAIRSWKDRLPDGARLFQGGFEKARLASRNPEYLAQFARETWRGELCHWAALGCTPLFFLWNPAWADAVMFACGLSLNLPCILAQRHNRARLQRLLAARARRHPGPGRPGRVLPPARGPLRQN